MAKLRNIIFEYVYLPSFIGSILIFSAILLSRPYNPFASIFRSFLFVIGVFIIVLSIFTSYKKYNAFWKLFLLFTILICPFIVGIDEIPLQGDEIVSINGGINIVSLVLQGRVFDPAWEDYGRFRPPTFDYVPPQFAGPQDVPMTYRLASPVGKFIMGVGPWIAGFRDVQSYNEATKLVEKNFVLVILARLPLVIAGALTCIVVFVLGRELISPPVGWFAAFVLASNPLWLMISRWAKADGLAILFSSLAILIFYRATRSKGYSPYIVSGVLLGLAIGAKYTAGLTAITIFLFSLSIIGEACLKGDGNRAKALSTGLIIIMLTSLATFVATYPFLYPDPPGRFLESLQITHNKAVVYNRDLNPYLVGIKNPVDGILINVHRLVYPIVVAADPIEDTIQVGWSIHQPFGVELPYGNSYVTIFWTLFFLIGLACILSQLNKNSRVPGFGLLLAWLFVTFVGLAVGLPANRDHYVAPLIVPMVLFVAYGFHQFLNGRILMPPSGHWWGGFIVGLNFLSVSTLFPDYYGGILSIMANPVGFWSTTGYIAILISVVLLMIKNRSATKVKIVVEKRSG